MNPPFYRMQRKGCPGMFSDYPADEWDLIVVSQDSAPAVQSIAPLTEWRRTVLPCLDCGVDRNTEQHKPGCRHEITNSASTGESDSHG